MEREIILTILFDYYEKLLTEKQRSYFKSYYFDNLSLTEISENLKVSRNAIHKELKFIKEKLNFYEDSLKLYQKEKELDKIINKIDNIKLKKELETIKNI